MGDYGNSLVPPFTVMTSSPIPRRKILTSRRDSGPYKSLRDAYQILVQRRRENMEVWIEDAEFWIEDAHAQVVDLDLLNEEDNEMENTQICTKCGGTQVRVIPATVDVPPDNAIGAILRFRKVVSWIIWCECKETFAWFSLVENGAGSTHGS